MGWRIALWVVLVVSALYFLFLVRSILLPFVLALLISAILGPTIKKLRLRGFSKGGAITSVFLAFIAVVTIAGVVLIPLAASQFGAFATKVQDFATALSAESPSDNFFTGWNPATRADPQDAKSQVDKALVQLRPTLDRFGLPSSRHEIIKQYIEPYRADVAVALQTFFGGFLGFVSGFASQFLMLLFTPLFVLFIITDLDRIKRRFAGMIPPAIRAQTLQLIEEIGDVFFSYLRGVTTVLAYYVAVASVLLTVLGAPYSVLLAILFALIYLIPFAGQAMNAIILFLLTMGAGKSGGWLFTMSSPVTFALTITAIFAVAMIAFDQLFYARLVGKSVGLHPLVSFFVVFAGAALFGAKGMLLAFPVAGSVKVILDRLLKFTSNPVIENSLPVVPLRHRTSNTG